eukprot:8917330-Pyramimonas_sp.AAC.1
MRQLVAHAGKIATWGASAEKSAKRVANRRRRSRKKSGRTLSTVQHNPVATRPLGTPSRLGFQRILRRSVAAAVKIAMIVA